jgi:nicotinate phosphoribosyltransferase
MWLMKTTPALFTDLYELTMAQAYFRTGMDDIACFEVFVRHLPEHWGFFVMAGLPEVQSYLRGLRFDRDDIEHLRSLGMFQGDFLEYLSLFALDVKVRALPEGTAFFPNEPVMEVSGPILHAQLLESYILNILGFSIIEATLGGRMTLAARGIPVIDFGLRRCQGPISSIRAARGGQMAGFAATSNVFAAKLLDMPVSGTMAHSFVEAHDSEEQAFRDFADLYGERAILLVDTYDSIEGIKTAGRVAGDFAGRGIRIRGIRLDSGDLVQLSRFARDYFQQERLDFLQIFASGDLDEFRIADLLASGAQIDGFGVGTRFTVSQHAPAIGIVYKVVRYDGKGLYKVSPGKATLPGRKTVTRIGGDTYVKDIVQPLDSNANDLLRPFESAEPMQTVRERLATEISRLPDRVKAIRDPASYPVELAGFKK